MTGGKIHTGDICTGLGKIHPSLMLIATGPLEPLTISPLTISQYTSEPISKLLSMISLSPQDQDMTGVDGQWIPVAQNKYMGPQRD